MQIVCACSNVQQSCPRIKQKASDSYICPDKTPFCWSAIEQAPRLVYHFTHSGFFLYWWRQGAEHQVWFPSFFQTQTFKNVMSPDATIHLVTIHPVTVSTRCTFQIGPKCNTHPHQKLVLVSFWFSGKLLEATKWSLCIGGLTVADVNNPITALCMLFSSYYIFNLQYPASSGGVMEFIQRLVKWR